MMTYDELWERSRAKSKEIEQLLKEKKWLIRQWGYERYCIMSTGNPTDEWYKDGGHGQKWYEDDRRDKMYQALKESK